MDASERVARVVSAMRRDVRRAWTVADMAAVLGIQEAQIRRLFRLALLVPPRLVLCQLRLEEAAALLDREPTLLVKEVVSRTGYGDSSHFCRDFRDRYGMSPTEYRRRHRDRDHDGS
jgi:transcriptional regulator GlxA family with amidase domain